MASERLEYVAASGSTLHASWDAEEHASERPSASRALATGDAAEAVRTCAQPQLDVSKPKLLRRASQQLLRIGQVERGLRVLQGLSDSVSLRVADGSAAVHMQLKLSQLQLRLRGIERARNARPSLSAEAALRLRSLRMLAGGSAGYTPGHAFAAATRYVQVALDAEDSLHLVRALGLSAALGSAADLGDHWPARALARMDAVAQDDGSREAQGFASLIHGVVSHCHDEFGAARKHAGRAQSLLRGCLDVEAEITHAQLLDLMSASGAGDYADSVRLTPPWVEAAFRRGHVYNGALLSGVHGLPAWLAPDDPGGYQRVLADARQRLRQTGSAEWPEQCLGLAEAALSIYLGEPAHGYALIERISLMQRRSLRSPRNAQNALFVARRGMCAAAALRDVGESRRWELREVIERSIRALTRFGGASCLSTAEGLRAALALDTGLWLQATHRLAATLQLQAAAGLEMSAAATRRRLGQLTGGAAGRRLVESADASMQAQGIRNLEAMTELLCPGVRR